MRNGNLSPEMAGFKAAHSCAPIAPYRYVRIQARAALDDSYIKPKPPHWTCLCQQSAFMHRHGHLWLGHLSNDKAASTRFACNLGIRRTLHVERVKKKNQLGSGDISAQNSCLTLWPLALNIREANQVLLFASFEVSPFSPFRFAHPCCNPIEEL